ncbi:MAG: acetolactate synthase small subunit [Anaerolineaceae bacterium]|nr:acetolactate synthase small subunit [Anaerolineaceae bacterium]MCY4024265.1 acetolactate synthase small subunit [Anaerolineaceae bacterium]
MSDETGMEQKVTLVTLVDNRPGVLNRIASLFRRRNFNIDSLTVGRTHRQHVSRMTIVVDARLANVNIIAANLRKLVNVIEVRVVSDEPHVSRDLALIKVRTDDPESRNMVTEICERYPGRIVDMGVKVAIVEVTAHEEQVEAMIEEFRPIGIVEMVRTGVVAMGRGIRIQDTQYEPPQMRAGTRDNGVQQNIL